jgi:cell division protein FtsB
MAGRPADRQRKDAAADTSPPRRTGLTGRAAILALVIAALIVSYASSLRAWSEQQARLQELRVEAAQRSERVAELERELDRWHDPAYVEAQARDRFGWVMPGEIGYVVVGADERSPANDPTSTTAGDRERRAWWSALWGSVERAGTPPRPKPAGNHPEPAATIDPGSGDPPDDG